MSLALTTRAPTAALRRLVTTKYGHAFSSEAFNSEGMGVPVIRIRDILPGRVQTWAEERPDTRAWVNDGDVVIGMDGDFNHTLWRGGPAAMNQRVCSLEAGPRMNTRFLNYVISYPLRVINETVHHTTVKHLSFAELLAERVPVPPLAAQQQIADYLDAETARIDALIAKKEQLADLAQLRADAEAEFLLDRFDDVPLQHLTDPKRPTVYGIVQAGPNDPDGVPYVKSGDVADLGRRELSKTATSIHRQYVRSHVRPGDIVVAMRASIGALAVVPPSLPEANLTQGTARIAPDAGVDGRWLYQSLRLRRVQDEMDVRAVGSTFRTLNIWDLRRIGVPTPPADEQEQLAEAVEAIRRRADALARKLVGQVNLLREHRQALITAAVSGELEVPGVAA